MEKRTVVRLTFAVVPWIGFIWWIDWKLRPKDMADWLYFSQWLLIPFLPLYTWILTIVLRATRRQKRE